MHKLKGARGPNWLGLIPGSGLMARVRVIVRLCPELMGESPDRCTMMQKNFNRRAKGHDEDIQTDLR